MSEWQDIETAPRDATHIEVLLEDGTIHNDCHYAVDITGEWQAPFKGWFIPTSTGFVEINKPVKWRPKKCKE